jgi:hypothetical protein
MPLNCKDIVAQSSDYIENSQTGDSSINRLAIKFHLLMCHHCRRFVRHKKITNEYLFKHQQLNQISDSELEKNIECIMEKIKNDAPYSENNS